MSEPPVVTLKTGRHFWHVSRVSAGNSAPHIVCFNVDMLAGRRHAELAVRLARALLGGAGYHCEHV